MSDYEIYLPIVFKPQEEPGHELPYPLGAQIAYKLGGRDQYCVEKRLYHYPLYWDEIELSPGVYTFSNDLYDTVNRLDNKLGRDNYQLILGTKCCPPFYSTGTERNSPPKPEHYIDYARFVESACLTFHPWGVEVWNEPEALPHSQWFGGFGHMGGADYGRLARTVYDLGLPTKIVSGASIGLTGVDITTQFLRDAVQAGMKSDYWSFHAYINYWEVIDDTLAFQNIIDYSRNIQTIYNVPQLITETSVLRDTDLPEILEHRQRQVELLQFLYDQMPTTAIKSVLWYTLAETTWEHSSMVQYGVVYPIHDLWTAL